MYWIRLMLKMSVLMCGYACIGMVFIEPYFGFALVFGLLLVARKKTVRLTAFGTARWAETHDLKGMINE